MQIHAKVAVWILGLLTLAVSLVGIGLSSGFELEFLQSLPQNLLFYFIGTGLIGLIGLVLGLSRKTY